LADLREYLTPAGAIWVVHTKGKGAAFKDVDVFAAAREGGPRRREGRELFRDAHCREARRAGEGAEMIRKGSESYCIIPTAARGNDAVKTLTPYGVIHLDSTVIAMPYFGRSVMIG
jgi:hypothetical protein